MEIMMKRLSIGKRAGFTLLELLVVISIIAILMSLLFAALNGAKLSARKKQADAEARSIGLAVRAFYVDLHRWPGDPEGDRKWGDDNYLVVNDLVQNGRRVYLERLVSQTPYCDPFGSGKNAYRILITNDVIKVWSIGPNGVDNEGKSDDISSSN